MSSSPTCDFVFPDRYQDVREERLELLIQAFSVFGRDTSVQYALNDSNTTRYTVQFPSVYKGVLHELPDEFDLGTFTGSAVSLKDNFVGHPFSSRVVLVEKEGRTVYDLKHTRAEFDPVDGKAGAAEDQPLSIMSMVTHILRGNNEVIDRDNYDNHGTMPRPTQTMMLKTTIGSVTYTETYESVAGPLALGDASADEEVTPSDEPSSSRRKRLTARLRSKMDRLGDRLSRV
jgi:hypothetical protein